ncbi:hypothetical protein [Sulfobacillus harzensis]|uniref:HNH endonuclease n=1 Tax=Sulfobacillus harzensis TaxID=2729629 RepID=A0A7Y0Q690_9FIRM|nr:hypothetical protein [Sulfobacillus harzensis]NMP25084.1 hypothetical protein [Sulfobacillus harzensis]
MSSVPDQTPKVREIHFHVGVARWRQSLAEIVTPLIPLLDAQIEPWPGVFGSPYAITTRQIRSPWTAWLHQAQHGRCFWCHNPLSTKTSTVEHVLPYEGAIWPTASRVEQLLSLRLSHSACNTAYAAWRAQQNPAALQAMDERLLHLIQQTIRAYPIFQLYGYQQHRPLALLNDG